MDDFLISNELWNVPDDETLLISELEQIRSQIYELENKRNHLKSLRLELSKIFEQ